ncbi:serine hydrolase [Ruixingdingia sedimenti]|uniref:Serine hydrolase n=1 Tax=Ruixingdingia sedimenti TaxID=3073604 RepID=A0ABU1FA56_9RHOB|nr:serine hydrolase [Xinfangfangia sp. LG-4]MDR5653751.1 serine hydrolase [Xinfangfangia sp. LG-4]
MTAVMVWLCLTMLPLAAAAAPYAAVVMDARSGKVLYAHNADTRLHPASLTKMMTLYIAFDAVRRGEISLDTMVTVSSKAAGEAPSKLGLRTGQKIALRNLIRAAAIKSANDAATAIGEAISGSEAAFAKRMTRTAKALGMKNTTFRNANGLTENGHLSTARDMTVLGRRLFYDFPEYYNLFSRITEDAGVARVSNTNRRFLESYKGADGIKTGYTQAAGFNLTASAERGNKRIIATVFGGTSTAQRNAKMAELLDLGFKNAPAGGAVQKPPLVAMDALAEPSAPARAQPAAKTIRVSGAVKKSPRPMPRPAAPEPEVLVALNEGIESVLAEVAEDAPAEAVMTASAAPKPRPEMPVETAEPVAEQLAQAVTEVVTAPEPAPAAETLVATGPDPEAEADTPQPQAEAAEDADSLPENVRMTAALVVPETEPPVTRPQARPGEIVMTAARTTTGPAPRPNPGAAPEVVTRISTSGGRHWGVTLGRFPSRGAAERALLQTALTETTALDGALRKVVSRGGGYDANFLGLSQDQADLACRRLQARAIQCFTMGP